MSKALKSLFANTPKRQPITCKNCEVLEREGMGKCLTHGRKEYDDNYRKEIERLDLITKALHEAL